MADKKNNNGVEETVVEETVAEENGADEAAEAEGGAGADGDGAMGAAGKTINDAFKQVEKQFENISKALGSALQDRANVVMVRVNDDSLAYLDMLVEADITKSRSESAAFLVNEGIKDNEALFNRIREITDQIVALKSQLRDVVSAE